MAVKRKGRRESINLRDDDDIDTFKKFLFLITNTESFKKIKDKAWREGEIKSQAFRLHMEKYVEKYPHIFESKKEEYEEFLEDYDIKIKKREEDAINKEV